jgi:hypothetical protein
VVRRGDAADGTRAVLAFKRSRPSADRDSCPRAGSSVCDGSGATAALLFGGIPSLITSVWAAGRAAMLLALALGALALARNKDGFALAFFAIAVLVKPAAIFAFVILAGVLLRERRWRQAALGAGTLLLAAVVLWWPFWEGARTFEAMLDEGRYFTTTPASLLQRALEPYVGGDPARVLVGGALRVALAALVLLAILRTAARPAAVSLAIGEIHLLAVVVLGTWYQPWYATWPLLFLAVAAATGAPRALPLVLGLTAGRCWRPSPSISSPR